MERVKERGNGVGYYVAADNDGQKLMLYLGGGFSVPVMSYEFGSRVLQVSPSIDVCKLKDTGDWQKKLNEKLKGDMFIYTDADNNLADFEKNSTNCYE